VRALQAAAVARLEAVWLADRVHDVGDVPGSPATPYVVVSASAGMAENHLNCGTHGSKAHRVIVQCVGATAAEVGFALEKADAAFQDHALVITGYDTTPATAELEANVIRDPDGGALLVVTQTYTFAAYPI
jgi:hypothetical protein